MDLTPYLKIKTITGRGIVNRDVEMIEVPGIDGAHYKRKKRPPRPLGIESNIIAKGRTDLRLMIDELNGILAVDEPKSIIFPDEPNIEYFGIPAQTGENDEFFFMHQGQMTIICPNPDKYGSEKVYNFTSGAIALTNNGTADAKPIIDVTMDVASSDLVISNGEKTLRVIYDLVIGDALQIDFQKRKVFINGVLQMTAVDLNNPHFFALKPGENNLTITPATTASLTYREMWK